MSEKLLTKDEALAWLRAKQPKLRCIAYLTGGKKNYVWRKLNQSNESYLVTAGAMAAFPNARKGVKRIDDHELPEDHDYIIVKERPENRLKKNSKQKGSAAERQVANLLKEFGYNARRTNQFCGKEGTSDVTCKELPWHIEVKSYQRIQAYDFLDQAKRDLKTEQDQEKMPIVFMKADYKPWTVMIDAVDFLELIREKENENSE